jgi:uncharacterized protein YjbJ (UPF0337 family)
VHLDWDAVLCPPGRGNTGSEASIHGNPFEHPMFVGGQVYMNKQEIEGSLDEAAGKVKEVAGKVTHSHTTVAKGKAEQVKGEAKKQAGKVQDAIEHSGQY